MKTVLASFEIEDDANVDSFLETIGQNLPYVLSAQQLDTNNYPGTLKTVGDKLDFVTGQF